MRFEIYRAEAASILSPTSGFIAQAGFTHSLSPARNCTFACTYCYVPTMRIYGGLKPEDWNNWGRFTTFKSNAPGLLRQALRPNQVVYCSPLVDPYQPAEETERMMPRLLDCLIENPPRVFAVQTRGPLIVRDLERLRRLTERTILRVSFSGSGSLCFVGRPILAAAAFSGGQSRLKAGCGQNCPPYKPCQAKLTHYRFSIITDRDDERRHHARGGSADQPRARL